MFQHTENQVLWMLLGSGFAFNLCPIEIEKGAFISCAFSFCYAFNLCEFNLCVALSLSELNFWYAFSLREARIEIMWIRVLVCIQLMWNLDHVNLAYVLDFHLAIGRISQPSISTSPCVPCSKTTMSRPIFVIRIETHFYLSQKKGRQSFPHHPGCLGCSKLLAPTFWIQELESPWIFLSMC